MSRGVWSTRLGGAGLAAALALSCSGSTTAGSKSPTPEAKVVRPPQLGATPAFRAPEVQQARLENGLGLRVVEGGRLPLVELRLVVLSGRATDGDEPGVAALTGRLLSSPGPTRGPRLEALTLLESLGAELTTVVARDATELRVVVDEADVPTALSALAELATHGQFSEAHFERARRQSMERAAGLARSDANWTASMALYRQLYHLSDKHHPYARHDATSSELESLTVEDVESWHQRHFSPRNAFLVAVGSTTLAQVVRNAQAAFGSWEGSEVAPPIFFEPAAPTRVKIWLVHRAGSHRASLRIATLGPERQSTLWSRARVATQILGGGRAGRLFKDLRDSRGLAYDAESHVEEVAYGPSPVVLSAVSETRDAPETLSALLDHFDSMGRSRPSTREVQLSSSYLHNRLLLRQDTTASTADLATRLGLFALPDGYYSRYRDEIRGVTPREIELTAARLFDRAQAVVVVAGDAEKLERPLSHFGQVHTLIPEDDFRVDRVVTHDPSAPL